MSFNRIISFFLLALLLIINWHNSFFHTHSDPGTFTPVHEHAYHHQHESLSVWDWFTHMMDDFEHPDMGDNHFELFLHSNSSIAKVQFVTPGWDVFWVFPQVFELNPQEELAQKQISFGVYVYSDPPIWDADNKRGPPQFS